MHAASRRLRRGPFPRGHAAKPQSMVDSGSCGVEIVSKGSQLMRVDVPDHLVLPTPFPREERAVARSARCPIQGCMRSGSCGGHRLLRPSRPEGRDERE